MKNPRLTILGSIEGWLCIFPPLAQFSEQRASPDGLPTEALELAFVACFWGDLVFLFVFLCSGKILCTIQTAAIFYFRPSHLPDWKAWKPETVLTRSKRKLCSPSAMDQIQLATDEKHSIWEFFTPIPHCLHLI